MESKKVHEVLDRMLANLNCPICLDLMKTPMATNCEHSFCKHCILATLGTKTKVPCPLCKEQVTKRSLKPQETMDGIVGAVRNLITAYEMDKNALWSPVKGPPLQLDISMTPETSTSQPRATNKMKLKDFKTMRKNAHNTRYGKKKTTAPSSEIIFLDDSTSESSRGSALKSPLNISDGFPNVTSRKSTRRGAKNQVAEAKPINDEVEQEDDRHTPDDNDGPAPIMDILDSISQKNPTHEKPNSSRHKKGKTSSESVVFATESVSGDAESVSATENLQSVSQNEKKSELINVLNSCELGASFEKEVEPPDGYVPLDVKKQVEKLLQCIEMDSHERSLCRKSKRKGNTRVNNALKLVRTHLKEGLSSLDESGQSGNVEAESAARSASSYDDIDDAPGHKSDISNTCNVGDNPTIGNKKAGEILFVPSTSSKSSSELDTFIHKTFSKKTQGQVTKSHFKQLQNKQISSSEKVKKWMRTLVQDSPGEQTSRALKCLYSVQNTPSSDATILVGERKKSEDECSVEDVNDDDTTDEIAIHASFCNESESEDNFDDGDVGDDNGCIEGPDPNSVKNSGDASEVIIIEDETTVPDSPLHKPAVPKRKRIFKSRPSAGTDPTPSKPQGNSGTMTIYKYGESQEDVDPYAFQMSQRTPKANEKKCRSRSRGKEVKVKEVKVNGVGKGKKSDVPTDAEDITSRSRSRGKNAAGNEGVPGERCGSPSESPAASGTGTKSRRGKSKGGRGRRAELSGRLGQLRRVQAKDSRETDISLFDLEDETIASGHEMDVDAGGVMVTLGPVGDGLPVSDVATGSNGCESQDNLLITGKAVSPWAAVQQDVKQYTRKSRCGSRGKKKLIRRSDGGVQGDVGEDRTDGVGKIEVAKVEDVPEIKNLSEKISDAESFELDCMTFSQQIQDEEEVRRTLVNEKDKRLSRLEKSEREKMRKKRAGEKRLGGEEADAVNKTPETRLKLQSLEASAVQSGVRRTDVDLPESSQFKVPLPKGSKLKSVVKADLVGNSEKSENADMVALVSGDEEAIEMAGDDSDDNIKDKEIDLDVVGATEIQDDDDSDAENVEQDTSVNESPSRSVQVIAETPLLARPRFKKIDLTVKPEDGDSDVENVEQDISVQESPSTSSSVQVIAETPLLARLRFKKIDLTVKPEDGASDGDCTPSDVEIEQDANASSIQVIAETPLLAGPKLSHSPVLKKGRRAGRPSLHEKHLPTEDIDVTVPLPKRSRRSTRLGTTPEKCLEGKDTDAKKDVLASPRRSRRSKSEVMTPGALSFMDPKSLVVTDNDLVKLRRNGTANVKTEDDYAKHDLRELESHVQDNASGAADTIESSPVKKRKHKTRRLKPNGDKEVVTNASGEGDKAGEVTENCVAAIQDSVSVIPDTMEIFDSPVEKKPRKPHQSELLVKDDEILANAGAMDALDEEGERNDVMVIADTMERIESSLEKIGSKIRRSRIYNAGEIGDDAKLVEVDMVKEVDKNCREVSRSSEKETADGSVKIVEEADENAMQSTGEREGGQSVILVEDTPIVQSKKEEIPVNAAGEKPRCSVGSLSPNSGSVTERESDTESIDLPSGLIEYEDCDPSIQKSPVRVCVDGLGDVKPSSETMETEESRSMLQPNNCAVNSGSADVKLPVDLVTNLDAENSTKRTVLSWSDSDDEIVFRKPKRKTFSLGTSPLKMNKKSCPAFNEPNSLFDVGQSLGECLREIHEETDIVPVEGIEQTTGLNSCGVQDEDGTTEQTVPESSSGLQGLTHISDTAKSSEHENSGRIGAGVCLEESPERSESGSNRARKEEQELPLSSSSSKGQSLSSSRSQSGNSDINSTGEIVPATPSASYFTTQPIKLDALLINEPDKSPVENAGKPEKRSRLSRRSKKRTSDRLVDTDITSKKVEENAESSAKLPEVGAEGNENMEKKERRMPGNTAQTLAECNEKLLKRRGCKCRDVKVTEADHDNDDSNLESGHVVVESYTQFLKEVQYKEEAEERIEASESAEVQERREVGSCQNSQEQERVACLDDAESCLSLGEQNEMDDVIVEDPLKTTPYFTEEDSEVDDDLDLLPSLPSADNGQTADIESEDNEIRKDAEVVDVVNSHEKNLEEKFGLKSDRGDIPDSVGIRLRLERDEMKRDGVAVKCSVQDYESNFSDINEAIGDNGGEETPNKLGVHVKHDEIAGPVDSKSANENETSSSDDILIPKTPLLPSRSFRKRGLKITKSIKPNDNNVTLGSSVRSDLSDQSSEEDEEPKNRKKSPKLADSPQSLKTSSAFLKKDRFGQEQMTLNYEQTTLKSEQTSSKSEQTTSKSGQTNSQKEQRTLEGDQTSNEDQVNSSEKDYSYLNTDEAVARVYQNYYNTTPEVLLKHIKDEPTDSCSEDCKVVKVEAAPSVQSDEEDDDLTADDGPCSADSGDENIPDAASTQGSCRTMNTTSSSEILPTQMREELEAEMAEIKAQMEAKRALMNDMSSERIDADDPDENQSDADNDDDLFDGPTPPPSPPSPNTSRTMASLNPTLAEDLQVLNKYRTRKTPDKHKNKKKTPAKSRIKTTQNVSKNTKTEDSDLCSDHDIVIQETPQKKIRRRIRCVSDSSSSDDGFENFIQKEKDSQNLPSQSWGTLGLGKHGTQNDFSEGTSLKLPDLGTEVCNKRQLGSSGGQSQSCRHGLKLPKRMSDNIEREYCKKISDSQGSASIPGLEKSDNIEKGGDFQRPTTTVSKSARRLSSQFGSPCVIPDSIETVDKREVESSRKTDRLFGISRKTMLESVSSSAETLEPSEGIQPVRIYSHKSTKSLSSQKFANIENDIDEQNVQSSGKGAGVKRKSCEDKFPDHEMMLDVDNIWNEDKHDCDKSSLSDADGHVPKRLRHTRLEMSPVVYKTYDLGSQHLLKSLSAVPYVKTNVNRTESPLAGDVHLGDNDYEKHQNIRQSEEKSLDDECQSSSRLGFKNVGSVGQEISPLAKTDTSKNSPRSAPDSVGKSSRKQSPCVETLRGMQSPKTVPSEKYDSQPTVVEIKVEGPIKTLSPRHTSMNVEQDLPSPRTRQNVVYECTTPTSVKQTPDFVLQRTSPKSLRQMPDFVMQKTTPKSVEQMTQTYVKQTPIALKQTPTSVKQTPENLPNSVKQVITPKSLKKTPHDLVDKENQLKRKAEAEDEGLDDVDGRRKRIGNVPQESPRRSPQVKRLVELTVQRQDASSVSRAVSSPARLPLPMRRGRTFVVSGLNQTMKDVMTNFIESFGFIYSSKFTEKTTHVVVQAVKDQPCVCERTLKYFLGIAGRCWVVSLNWMIDSVQQGVCLPEDDYEIHGDTVNGPNHNGPYLARNATRLLLDRFEIYCHGQFTGMPISDTKLLILMLGAKLVNHPKEFTADNPRCFIIAELDEKLKQSSYYDRLKQKFSAEVISREWLLDNVAQYRIQNPRPYSLCNNAVAKDE